MAELGTLTELRRRRMKEVLAMDLVQLQDAILKGEVSPEEAETWALSRMFGARAGPELDQELAKKL